LSSSGVHCPLFTFSFSYFFFLAEDCIRVFHVTGVQTCALPISEGNFAETAVEQRCAGSLVATAFGVVENNHSIVGQRLDAMFAAVDPVAAVNDNDMVGLLTSLGSTAILSVLIQIAIDQFGIDRFVAEAGFVPRLIVLERVDGLDPFGEIAGGVARAIFENMLVAGQSSLQEIDK